MTDTTREPSTDTDQHVNVTLTFKTDRNPAWIGGTVTGVVAQALPDQLTGVNWHAFTLDPSVPEE